MKSFAWSAVTYSSKREKKRSPSLVIAHRRRVQSRWPESSRAGRVPRGNHAARARPGRISWFDRYRLLWRPSLAAFLSELVAELFLLGFVSFGGYSVGFLIAQFRFFQQPRQLEIEYSTSYVSSRYCWISAGVNAGASIPTSSGGS
jgi:hypothetical protein